MTLAQFAMTFWHDLAAPILAGIITANGRQAAVMAICARNRPQG